MKIVRADWEKRNLGVVTYEISVGANDPVSALVEALEDCKDFEYIVLKVESENTEVSKYARKNGFDFIEACADLTLKPKDYISNKRLLPVIKRCSYRQMDKKDLDFLYDQINKGIFHTDRIYLDDFFDRSAASRRYINWINDLIAAGYPAYNVYYAETPVGFFIHKNSDDDIYDGILAGTYEDYEGTGMGYCVQWAGYDHVATSGGKLYLGHVSLTNVNAYKILMSMGFNVSVIKYVYVKHKI